MVRTTYDENCGEVSLYQIDFNCVDVDKSVFYLVKTRLSQGHSRDKFIAKGKHIGIKFRIDWLLFW
jgi:hypothetical protein